MHVYMYTCVLLPLMVGSLPSWGFALWLMLTRTILLLHCHLWSGVYHITYKCHRIASKIIPYISGISLLPVWYGYPSNKWKPATVGRIRKYKFSFSYLWCVPVEVWTESPPLGYTLVYRHGWVYMYYQPCILSVVSLLLLLVQKEFPV